MTQAPEPDSAPGTEPVNEPDRVPGAPHPRETVELFGQAAAEAAFLAAKTAGRLHHAWLLTGPRGIGKATLAWRIARHLIADAGAGPGLFDPAEAAATLSMPPDHPVFRRCAALSDPRLALVRRGHDERTGRLRGEITVAEIRNLRGALQLSAPDGGWRAVIIDAADEMNGAAANALLKFLEEPPAQVVFVLVSHQPARLLPTIRSRCRALRLHPLAAEAMGAALTQAGAHLAAGEHTALASLAEGSVGDALRLADAGGAELYAQLVGLLAGLPVLDRRALTGFAESLGGRGTEARRETAERLVALALGRLARAAATGRLPGTAAPGEAAAGATGEAAPGEAALAARFQAQPAGARMLAEAAQRSPARLAQARAVNLDPAQAMLDTLLELEQTARQLLPTA
ncbi:MAG: DNA polymerase III subunit delta' [Pseudomonadota bacterium]